MNDKNVKYMPLDQLAQVIGHKENSLKYLKDLYVTRSEQENSKDSEKRD